jgi:hypothetical protein
MSKRPKIGDIIEISLPENGFGYAQFTPKHKMYGALLRVFHQKEKVFELSKLDNTELLFTTLFPLGAAVNRGIVSIVGNLPIREVFQKFPVFRCGVSNQQGEIDVWWLWDGGNEKRVGQLSTKLMKYPVRCIINDTLLVERICLGWKG